MFSAYHILQARMAKQAHHQRRPSVALSPVKDELTLNEDLLLCGNRIVVTKSMQAEALHQGHQDMQRCHLRVACAV